MGQRAAKENTGQVETCDTLAFPDRLKVIHTVLNPADDLSPNLLLSSSTVVCLCVFSITQPLLSHILYTIPPFSAIFRLNLCLGEGINVAVGIYSTAVLARKPSASRLYRETNEPVHSKTRTFHTQTGSLLLPSEIKKAQVAAVSLYAHFDFVSSKCVLRKI